MKEIKKTGIPKCIICGKPMKMAYDSKLKKRSEHLWEFQCKCHPENLRVGLG